jgi:hypothetical protein
MAMITITKNQQIVAQLNRKLSSSQMETEFSKIISQIRKNPFIPEKKEDLYHPFPAVSNRNPKLDRLRSSLLSKQDYDAVRERWMKIIKEENKYPRVRGLSYDSFILMVCELYGCENVQDDRIPINRTAVVNLTNTGNPYTKTKPAITLQEDNLQFMCCFTQDYTFEYLKALGERTLAEYKILTEPQQNIPFVSTIVPKSEDKEKEQQEIQEVFEETEKTLESILTKAIKEKGLKYFIDNGVRAEELAYLAWGDKPQLSLHTFAKLPRLLNIPPEELSKIILGEGEDDLNVGF